MKKYLIVTIFLVLFLAGCAENGKINSNGDTQTTGKSAILSKILSEEDLTSYVVNLHSEEIFNTQSDRDKVINTSAGIVKIIKEPKTYYAKIENVTGNEKNEIETYANDSELFYRENEGEWSRQVIEGNGDDPTFTPDLTIDSNSILKKLEGYFEITETEDVYAAKLESNSENIDEIKNILFGELESNLFLGELSSIKAEFSFEKDTYYPISYDWKASFLNKDNNEVTEIKQSGIYEKINQIDEIEIPDEIKDL